MKRIVLLLASFALAVLAADFNGTWSGKADLTVNGEKQPATVYMVIKQEGSTVTGTAGQSKWEQGPIRNGKVEGDTLTFEVQPSDEAPVVKVVLKMEGEKLTGTAKGSNGDTTVDVTMELTKEKSGT